jgi:hypothetical protein
MVSRLVLSSIELVSSLVFSIPHTVEVEAVITVFFFPLLSSVMLTQ